MEEDFSLQSGRHLPRPVVVSASLPKSGEHRHCFCNLNLGQERRIDMLELGGNISRCRDIEEGNCYEGAGHIPPQDNAAIIVSVNSVRSSRSIERSWYVVGIALRLITRSHWY